MKSAGATAASAERKERKLAKKVYNLTNEMKDLLEAQTDEQDPDEREHLYYLFLEKKRAVQAAEKMFIGAALAAKSSLREVQRLQKDRSAVSCSPPRTRPRCTKSVQLY